MVSTQNLPKPAKPAASRLDYIPPLENGDHLDADEFMRRYEAMPDLKKAELIQGIVYIMASPLRAEQHGDPDNLAQGWLCNYRIATPGTIASTNSTIRLGREDVPQSDAHLRIDPACGGQTHMEDGYVVGAPELVFEIAASSASMDTHEKLASYREAGVREYLVWRTEDGELDWWVREDRDFRELQADDDGILKSRVFPGLWLDGHALLSEDGAAVMKTLNKGLGSREHAEFVKKLTPA